MSGDQFWWNPVKWFGCVWSLTGSLRRLHVLDHLTCRTSNGRSESLKSHLWRRRKSLISGCSLFDSSVWCLNLMGRYWDDWRRWWTCECVCKHSVLLTTLFQSHQLFHQEQEAQWSSSGSDGGGITVSCSVFYSDRGETGSGCPRWRIFSQTRGAAVWRCLRCLRCFKTIYQMIESSMQTGNSPTSGTRWDVSNFHTRREKENVHFRASLKILCMSSHVGLQSHVWACRWSRWCSPDHRSSLTLSWSKRRHE